MQIIEVNNKLAYGECIAPRSGYIWITPDAKGDNFIKISSITFITFPFVASSVDGYRCRVTIGCSGNEINIDFNSGDKAKKFYMYLCELLHVF